MATTPNTIPIPWTKAEKREMDRVGGRSDRGYGRCLLCGRPVRNGLMVHEVEGGGLLIPAEQPYLDEAADLGWWDIGPDCVKRLPQGYAAYHRG